MRKSVKFLTLKKQKSILQKLNSNIDINILIASKINIFMVKVKVNERGMRMYFYKNFVCSF